MDKNTQKEGSTFDEVMKGFKASRKYQESGFWDIWSKSWKLYNNKRVSIGYDGNVETFIPETFSLIQGIKAHLINGDLSIEFLPTHPDQVGDVNSLQDLFNYAWEKDMMDQKVDAAVEEELIIGNSYIFTHVGKDGLPCSRVVSARDCFFDPQATNYENLDFAGYRYLTTKEELQEEYVADPDYNPADPEAKAKIRRYQNLDGLDTWKGAEGDNKTAKQEREEMLVGSVSDNPDDVVECIVYFDKEKMVTIANRSVIIEEVDTPFQRKAKTVQSVDDQGNPVTFEMPEIEPFIPVAPFRNLTDPNMWYARGDVEVIAGLQEYLNDVVAQKSDNLTFTLNRMWALDPNFADKIDEIQSMPGAVFTVPPGALEQIETQNVGGDADNEIARTKSEMMEATAANELMAGTLAQSGRRSAYMINQELVMQGARFKIKIKNLENEAMRILAMNMWKVMQIYIDREIPVRVEGQHGMTWSTYNPGLYLGDYDIRVRLGSTAETIKETARQQAMQFFLLSSKMPFIDQQSLWAMTAQTLFDKTKRETASLIMPPSHAPTPTIVPKLIETFKPEDLYPDEQAQILAEAGIHPSPLREHVSGTPNPTANPDAAALHASIIHNPNPKHGVQDMSKMETQAASTQTPVVGHANVEGMMNG